MIQPRRALVTGGAGLIGAHLARGLASRGWDVTVVDDLSSGRLEHFDYLNIRPHFIRGDIADPAVWDSLPASPFDVIFHLAAQANVPKSVERPMDDFRSNVQGTLNVLEYARRSGPGKVIFPSTVSVYAPDAPLPLSESSPVRASSPYGAAKAAAEQYCFAYACTYGLDITVLRLFNIYGPLMNKYVIHDLFRKLQKDPSRLVLLGDGEQVRDYLFVDDAVQALVLAAENGTPGEVYNVGSGRPVRIHDLASAIIGLMGLHDVPIECTMHSWPGDIKAWVADITKIGSLGFVAHIPLAQGLAQTLAYLKKAPPLPL